VGVSTISQAAYIALHQDDEEEDNERIEDDEGGTRSTLLPALHHAAKHTINSHRDQEIQKNNVYVFLFTTYGSTGCSTSEEFPDASALFYTAGGTRILPSRALRTLAKKS